MTPHLMRNTLLTQLWLREVGFHDHYVDLKVRCYIALKKKSLLMNYGCMLTVQHLIQPKNDYVDTIKQ